MPKKDVEDKINRENLYELNHLPPAGYDFSAKKLTEKAKKKLKGYWLCTVNYNEKTDEIDRDAKAGLSLRPLDIKWQQNYSFSVSNCLLFLTANKFLKRA